MAPTAPQQRKRTIGDACKPKITAKATPHATYEQKQEITTGINSLSQSRMHLALDIIKDSVPNMKDVTSGEVLVDVDTLPYDVIQKLLIFLQESTTGLLKPPTKPPIPTKPAHCCCQKCFDAASKIHQNHKNLLGKIPVSVPTKTSDYQQKVDLAAEYVLKYAPSSGSDPAAATYSFNYQQGVGLAARILTVLKTDSEEAFDTAVHQYESLRVIYEANRNAAISAKDAVVEAQKKNEKVYVRQLKCAGLVDKREAAYRIHIQHMATLRNQILVDEGSDVFFALRLRLDIEVDALPAMITSLTKTLKKLAVWDRRAASRRSKFAMLVADMNERHDECQKLYVEGAKIQVKLDALMKRLDGVAGTKVQRGYFNDGKWYTQSNDEAVKTADVGVVGKGMMTTLRVHAKGCSE